MAFFVDDEPLNGAAWIGNPSLRSPFRDDSDKMQHGEFGGPASTAIILFRRAEALGVASGGARGIGAGEIVIELIDIGSGRSGRKSSVSGVAKGIANLQNAAVPRNFTEVVW